MGTDRFSQRPLAAALRAGLRVRKPGDGTNEKPDRIAITVLACVPLTILAVTFLLQLRLASADLLLAAAALLVGALLTAFTQIATWRERLVASGLETVSVRIRALDEAAAHVLSSLLMSVACAVAVLLVGVVSSALLPSYLAWVDGATLELLRSVRAWVEIALTAVAGAAFAYVVVSIVIVTGLLLDAYTELTNET
jgi:hypothetical protein